ncbi:MAG: hypothetical protein NT061_08885 [Spirochaetes bacterium]|nr:hypothetical protein [Spirochaetota bacterium]
MKKALVVITMIFMILGAVSAQPWSGGQGRNWNNAPGYGRGYACKPQTPSLKLEKINLEGKLELVSGRVAIKQEAKTYVVMIPDWLFGFIPGLVENATVKVEGYAQALRNFKDCYIVKVTSLTIDGRTIDLGSNGAGIGQPGGMYRGMMSGNGMMGGKGRW